MDEDALRARIDALENDNRRLRHLLLHKGISAEMRHQVRNTLSRARAILRLSAETHRSVEDYAAHCEERLEAILKGQTLITGSVGAGFDLYEVVMERLGRFDLARNPRVVVDGPPMMLDLRYAEVLVLVVHELTVNAVEHGSVPSGGGLAINWGGETTDGIPHLSFTWVETPAPGIPSAPRNPPGFGFQVLTNMLKYELGAETALTFQDGGFQYRFRVSMPQTAWDERSNVVNFRR